MMHRPWDCAQPDEWLPQSLRLCWGGSGDGGGGGFGGDSGGGFGGATTGGGDWGSSGSFDASGFNAATSDFYASALAASPGGFYDTGGPGIAEGALGAEFGGGFGTTGISGQPGAPSGAFGAELDAGGGGTSGIGNAINSWAQSTPAGGPGMGTGADLSGGFGDVGVGIGGGMYGGGGGGVFGGYGGGGGGGGYTGGGGGGSRGGGGFTSTAAGKGVTSPYADDTGPAGRGVSEVTNPYADDTGPVGRGESEVTSPYADDTGPEGRGEQEGPPQAEPGQLPGGGQPSEAEPEAAPAPSSPSRGDAEPDAQPAPSAFGPQSLQGIEPGAEQYGVETGINPGAAQYGVETDVPQQAEPGSWFDSLTQDTTRDDPNTLVTMLSNWFDSIQNAPVYTPTVTNPLNPFNAWNAPVRTPEVANPFTTTPQWAQNQNLRSFELFNPKADDLAQKSIDAKSLWDINTFLSQQNQTPINVSVFNAITKALSPVDEISSMGRSTPGGIEPGAEQYGFEPGSMPEVSSTIPGDRETTDWNYGPSGGLPSELGIESISPTPTQDTTPWGSVFEGTAPEADLATQLGREDIDATPWGSVFEAPEQAPDWGSVFEAPEQAPDWASVFEGTPGDIDWGAVFEGTPSIEGNPYSETLPAGDPSYPTSPDTAFSPGANPQDEPGYYVSDAQPSEPSGDPTLDSSGQPAGGQRPSTDDATTPGGDPALSGLPADAAPAGAPGQAQEGGGRPQSQGITLAQLQDAVYGTSGPYITRGGNVYGGHTIADIQAAVYGDSPPGMPTGNPSAPLTDDTTAPSYAPTPGGAQSFIPGGRGETDFGYDRATTDPAQSQPGQPDDDHDTPEPQDDHNPSSDPNAPRPPGDIPGRLVGEGGQYDNAHADNPRGSRTYSNSGRTDYPQGRPGIDFRTARQAGITPLFNTNGINTRDNDARLVENINRALTAMQERTGIPASSLRATSGWRGAFRTNGLEHGMVEETTQESVYSRSNPVNGRHFAAARPSWSNHGPGRAIDFSPKGDSGRALAWLRANAREFGLEHLGYKNGKPFDVPHIQLRGGGAGQQPSKQEQADQRALDAQGRQLAIDRGFLAPGRGQAPTQLAQPLPGRGGIGSDEAVTAPTQPLMIGFKGLNNAFDEQAFNDHAAKLGYAPVTVNSVQEARAILDAATGRIGFYGFSKGANTAHALLGEKGVKDKVDRVVTVAPFHGSQTQNFKGTNWDNYPDYSSRGIDPQGQGFNIQTREHTKEAQREAAAGQTAALPGGERGIGSDRSDLPWSAPPTEMPAARPPPDAPLPPEPAPRPPVDIPAPAPFMTPPARGPADPAMLARTIASIQQTVLRGEKGEAPIGLQTTKDEAIARGAKGREALIAAGIPPVMARAAITDTANKIAHAMGYYPGGPNATVLGISILGKVQSGIAEGVAQAMQGYQPKSGAVQGPFGFQPDAPAAPAAPGKQGALTPGLMDMLGNILSNFNLVSTAEARGRDTTLDRALALAREGGNFGGQPGTSVVGNKVFTFYAPGASGPKGMEGPMVGSKNNPLTTLDDVRNGAGFVSLAGHPAQFGKQVFIGDVTYKSPVDGQQYTLHNVIGRVDDSGGNFGERDNPEQNHFDIAVGNFSRGWNDSTAGRFVAGNFATAVPGRGIGADVAAKDQDTMVGTNPPAEAPPAAMRGLAKGGHVAKDEPVVVGEEGPEYFVPDEPGTVFPHMPQPGKSKDRNIDRWPKVPAMEYPGRYGGLEREILRQTRAAQNAEPGLMDMVDSGRLRLTPNWHAMLNDPALIALGRSRMDDRRAGIDPGAEQYGAFIPPPAPAAELPDPTSPLAQALGYGSIRRPLRVGRQTY